MVRKILENAKDCEDLAYGLIFLGTGGGGGTPQTAIDMLTKELEAGHKIELVDIDDLPGEAWAVAVAGMGARGAAKPSEEELARLGLTKERYDWLNRLTAAVQELVNYRGDKIAAIVPGEIGCFNTVAPIVVGLQLGLPTVDGDYAGGRAVAEVEQMIPDICGMPIYPMAFVDRWGDVCILKESCSSAMADRIGRMLCGAAFEGVGMAWYLMKAKDIQKVLAHNSLSRAMEIGRARREALEEGTDPVQAIVECTHGWLLFKGEVLEGESENRGQAFMFNYGTHHLRGIEEYAGEKFDIWYKNENHICWKNGEVYVTSPDLICIVDLETGEAKATYYVSAGQRVAVIGVKANPLHRTKKGIEVLGPRHFGFDCDYVPIEERVKS
ncbi:MAG: DUF917 domain-containing protein [Chloroflexi bacterium]|nr:DUF917 domain-containing protein [Chloroflexota bacterium]